MTKRKDASSSHFKPTELGILAQNHENTLDELSHRGITEFENDDGVDRGHLRRSTEHNIMRKLEEDQPEGNSFLSVIFILFLSPIAIVSEIIGLVILTLGTIYCILKKYCNIFLQYQ